ncbi:hypothetical protein BV379_17820 [Rhodovulum sulfidophilum]|nr:hypothetical protein BV379_17820 [Rhodovulum sulfidophilum]
MLAGTNVINANPASAHGAIPLRPEARPATLTAHMHEASGALAPVPPRPKRDAVRVAWMPRNALKRVVASMRSEIARLRPSKIWCVPFARNASGIDIHGDAWTWWRQADGENYAKGLVPVQGAVLNFRPTHVMPLGHVAMVSKVISQRKIMVDQANWIDNEITIDRLCCTNRVMGGVTPSPDRLIPQPP